MVSCLLLSPLLVEGISVEGRNSLVSKRNICSMQTGGRCRHAEGEGGQ